MLAWPSLPLVFAEPRARATIPVRPKTHMVDRLGPFNADVIRPLAKSLDDCRRFAFDQRPGILQPRLQRFDLAQIERHFPMKVPPRAHIEAGQPARSKHRQRVFDFFLSKSE